ncbi:hypothetical protein ACFQPA_12015 [Halomarina halobia]|uniref:Uncharacterized protein n=1 Tax=Halomarina halobia TaxID=3033386 RepID=A0ABD6A9F7_9EURY|nr:hypothetical protein [Halomarina sp. PSR21]
MASDSASVQGSVRQLFPFERDVLVLSLSMVAFSGLWFAACPPHEALIVGPAERNASGRGDVITRWSTRRPRSGRVR